MGPSRHLLQSYPQRGPLSCRPTSWGLAPCAHSVPTGPAECRLGHSDLVLLSDWLSHYPHHLTSLKLPVA